MLRSLYSSTHPQGDTVHCPDGLKLDTSLQDGCLNAPSISLAAYIFILNLAELSLPLLSVCVCLHIHHSLMAYQERTEHTWGKADKERMGETKT